MTSPRVLAWDGCINVRDLGGLPLEGGGETRFGVAVRADSIRSLTEAGWEAAAAYGVRLAVDLRGDDELADDPPGDVPIDVVRFPIPGEEVPAVKEWRTMADAYTALLATYRRQLTAAAVTVARAGAPVVIHCAGGRDRTGLAVALVLRLVGVPLDAIAADHALSDESWAPTHDAWIAEAASESERERRRRITTPAGRTMADVLTGTDVSEYLLGGGATREDLDTLMVRLRR